MMRGRDKFYSPADYKRDKDNLGEDLIASEIGLAGVRYYLSLMENQKSFYEVIFSFNVWKNLLDQYIFSVCNKETIILIKPYLTKRRLRDLPMIFAILSEDESLKKEAASGLEKLAEKEMSE